MDKELKVLLTGVNSGSCDIHIIDVLNNEYVNGFFVLGDVIKVVEKIKTVMEIYETKDLIFDTKVISRQVALMLREEGLI